MGFVSARGGGVGGARANEHVVFALYFEAELF